MEKEERNGITNFNNFDLDQNVFGTVKNDVLGRETTVISVRPKRERGILN